METELIDIYKSAINSMKNEIQRLNRCIQYEALVKESKDLETTATDLKSQLFSLQDRWKKPKNTPNFSSATTSPEKLSKHPEISSLELYIHKMTQKISSIKRTQEFEQEKLEDSLQQLNSNLQILVLKLNDSKRINLKLRAEQSKLVSQRKKINATYAKITNSLVKELSLNEKLDRIEHFEKKNREKVVEINFFRDIINDIKNKKIPKNPEVSKILEKVSMTEELRKKNKAFKENLLKEIQEVEAEIEHKKASPEKFTPAIANRNMRHEIRMMEIELSEKSKLLKELERDKLVAQVMYSEVIKKIATLPSKIKSKSLSNCNTYSSIPLGRASNTNFTKDSERQSKRNSVDIIKVLKNKTDCNITKDVINALQQFAPGENIAAKIIAFNRSGFNFPKKIN